MKKLYYFLQTMLLAWVIVWGCGLYERAYAQTPAEYVMPMGVQITSDTTLVVFWPNNLPNTQILQLARKRKDDFTWSVVWNINNGNAVSDTVDPGVHYEYVLARQFTNSQGNTAVTYNFISTGIFVVQPVNNGQVILVEDTLSTATIRPEVNRFIDDLYGDGYCVKRIRCNANDAPPAIRSRIIALYNAAPTDVRTVVLLGRVPVPYSGDIFPDGHTPDHKGAWPCDGYYGSMTGTWTDNTVNVTAATRNENDNIPGDGKFDHNYYPDSIQLAVGRIDFANMPAFGTQAALLKRYLDKNHAYRHRTLHPVRRALVDDNFGWLGGEIPVVGALRSFVNLFGGANVVANDYFTTLAGNSYLCAYGSGAGDYDRAGGVGTSADFAAQQPKGVFNFLFGSYFGDWDSQNNFMRASLASNGDGLTCVWSGRPYSILHHMGMGDAIGQSFRINQRFRVNQEPYVNTDRTNTSEMVHIGFMGDPTLKFRPVIPITNLTATLVNSNTDVKLDWTASVDTALQGHIVYRLDTLTGCYVLLTNQVVNPNTWTDPTPIPGFTNRYMVRVAKLEGSTGIYFNWSQGIYVNIFVPVPQCPTVTLGSQTNVVCNGRSTGAIDLNVTGGVTPYTYVWQRGGNNVGTSQDLTAIPAGTYNVTVTDGNSCTVGLAVTITEPPAIEVLMGSSNPSCPGQTNGTANAGAVNAPGPLTFLWSNGATTANINGLASGTYTVTITAGNGCTASNSVTLTAPVAIQLSQTSVPPSCTNPSGSITLSVTGGTPDYVFGWTLNGNPFANTRNLTGLGAGVYEVIVRDFNSCTATLSVTLTAPNAPTLAHTAVNVTCNGGNTGSVNLTATGGTPGYTYAWTRNGIPFGNNQNLTGLTAGTYAVTVTDQAGCRAVLTVPITEPQALTIIPNINQIRCFGGTGMITVGATGGTPDYTFAWRKNGTPMAETQPMITNLTSGTYSVTVTDNRGCTATGNYVINPAPTQINLIIDNVTDANCGQTVGRISITASGGTAPLNYAWLKDGNPYSNQEDITGLTPGTYRITVTDGNSCSVSRDTVVRGTAGPVINETTVVQPTCNGQLNGSITVIASGGTAPFVYTWLKDGAPFGNTLNISNLSAGLYNLTIRDNNACETSTSVTIINPAPVSVTGTPVNPTCFGGTNGTITITPAGGTAPYTYTWTKDGTAFGNNQNLTGLGIGVYAVTVRDNRGCTATRSFTLTQPTQPAAGFGTSSSQTICSGNVAPTVALSMSGGTVVRWERSTDNFVTITTVNNPFPIYNPGTLTQTTCFRAVVNVSGCVVTSTPACVTTVAQAAPGTLSSNRTVCLGSNTTLTLSGNTAPVLRWETSVDNFITAVTVNNTTTSITLTNVQSLISVRAVVSNGVCAPTASNIVTVSVVAPPVPGVLGSDNAGCEGEVSGTLQLTGYSGTIARWESSTNNFNSSAVIVNTTDVFSYANLTRTTQYRVVLINGSCPPVFSNPVTITVFPRPVGGTISGSATVCAGTNAGVLNLTGFVNAVVQWEMSGDNFVSDIVPIANATPSLTYINLTRTTFYRALVESSPCGTAYSTVASVTLSQNNASGGTLFSDQTVCANNNSGVLTLTGQSGPILYWEVSIDDFATFSTLANTTGSYNYSNLPRTTWFRAVTGGIGSCPQLRSNGIKVTAVETARAGELSVNVAGGGGCSANSGVIVMNGYSGTIIRWEMSTDNFNRVVIPISHFSNAYTYNVGGVTQFRAVLQNSPCPPVFSNFVTVTGGLAVQVTPLMECNNRGKIVAMASGGTAPYTYFLTPNSGNQSQPGVFTNVVPGTYTVTVRDRNNCVATRTVNIPRALTGPMITSVQSLGANIAQVTWDDVAPGGNNVYYQLRYRPIGGAYINRNVGSNTTFIITGLLPETRYEVQVRVRCLPSVTYSTWSSLRAFQMREDVLPMTVSEAGKSISLYPNPNNGQFRLKFEQTEVPAEIQVIDMNGKMIYERSYSEFEVANEPELNLTLSKGVYLVRIIQDGEVKSLKMMAE